MGIEHLMTPDILIQRSAGHRYYSKDIRQFESIGWTLWFIKVCRVNDLSLMHYPGSQETAIDT